MSLIPIFKLLNKGWADRSLVLLLSLLYMSASLQLGTMIQVFQHHDEREASKGWACAMHKCACKSARQCSLHCCCKPKALVPESGEKDEPTLAQCSGPTGDAGLLNLRLAPHFFAASLPDPSPPAPRLTRPLRVDQPLFRPLDPLLKVPISSSLS